MASVSNPFALLGDDDTSDAEQQAAEAQDAALPSPRVALDEALISDEELAHCVAVLERVQRSKLLMEKRMRPLRKALHPLIEQQIGAFGLGVKREREGKSGESRAKRKRARNREENRRRLGQAAPSLAETPSPAIRTAHALYGDAVQVPDHFLSRLLYTNPVCLLTTYAHGADAAKVYQDARFAAIARTAAGDEVSMPEEAPRTVRNIMTISWLTAIANDGTFVCAVNNARHSLRLIRETRRFVLNVPVVGMEPVVWAVGSCHGDTRDKAEALGLGVCAPGWGELQSGGSNWAIRECVAHMVCKVEKSEDAFHAEHTVFCCTVERAFVRSAYWNGKTFVPLRDDVPPYLSFPGSRTFAAVRPLQSEPSKKQQGSDANGDSTSNMDVEGDDKEAERDGGAGGRGDDSSDGDSDGSGTGDGE